jgi:hypothetical protein
MEDFKMKYKHFKKSLSVLLAVAVFCRVLTSGWLTTEVEANVPFRCGDINGDGAVNANDILEIQMYLGGMNSRITEEINWHRAALTCRNTGVITVADMNNIQVWSAGIQPRCNCNPSSPAALNTVMIVFNSQGGTLPSGSSRSKIIVRGGRLDSEAPVPIPTRANHIFNGWWTTPTTGGVQRFDNSTFTEPRTELHARWVPYTVALNTPLIPQEHNDWCGIASALMAVRTNGQSVPTNLTQQQLVNRPGIGAPVWPDVAANSASNTTNYRRDGFVITENVLILELAAGRPVIVVRQWLNTNVSHATVIHGYDLNNGTFRVRDSWRTGVGANYTVTYAQIVNGTAANNTPADFRGTWTHTIRRV